MEALTRHVKVNGTGGVGITATQHGRDGNVCIYQRSDRPYEVFIVQMAKEGEIMGKMYPERETYPSNEDFGKTAWCFGDAEAAKSKFKEMIERGTR